MVVCYLASTHKESVVHLDACAVSLTMLEVTCGKVQRGRVNVAVTLKKKAGQYESEPS